MKIIGCIKRFFIKIFTKLQFHIKKIYNEYKIKKIIQFELTYDCNYRCEYCLQNEYRQYLMNENKSSAPNDVIDGFISFISKYKKKCKVRLLGGEIFMHKRVMEIIKAILENGHDVDITTNFSFPLSTYKKILDFRKKGANVRIAISLHLSQVDLDKFKDKLDELFQLQKGDKNFSIGIQSVLLPENLEILDELNKYLIKKYEKPLIFQNYKEDADESGIEYDDNINEFLENDPSVVKDAEFKRKNQSQCNSIYGTYCLAGKKYCLIKADGYIYRCYGSENHGSMGILGNIKNAEINFHKRIMPCLSKECNCSLFTSLGLIKFGHKNIFDIKYCEKKYLKKDKYVIAEKSFHL